MDAATEFPSLMDDAEFLGELEKLEGAPPARAADRASHVALATGFHTAPRPLPSASTRPAPVVTDVESARLEAAVPQRGGAVHRDVVRRDVDRWQLTAGEAENTEAAGAASMIPAFLTIIAGLSAGAASAALMFHDRVGWLLQLWSR